MKKIVIVTLCALSLNQSLSPAGLPKWLQGSLAISAVSLSPLAASQAAAQETYYAFERQAPKKEVEAEDEAKENAHVRFMLAHGQGGDAANVKNAYCFTPAAFIPGAVADAFDFADVAAQRGSHLAQTGDIERCLAYYHATHAPLVAFGVSRGATTLNNLLGRNKLPKIKAAILESPFADVKHIIQHKIGPVASFFGFARLVELAIPYFAGLENYRSYDVRPLDVAHKIDHNTPILIVCSKEDALIPDWSSTKLYEEMINGGHKKAHLLRLNHGRHGNIIFGRDAWNYRHVVHAFLRHYKKDIGDVTIKDIWADAGQKQFEETFPKAAVEVEESTTEESVQ